MAPGPGSCLQHQVRALPGHIPILPSPVTGKIWEKKQRLACSETEPNACCFALPELHHIKVLRSLSQKQLKDHQEVTSTLNPPPPAAGLQLLHPRAACYCTETPAHYHQQHQGPKQKPPRWLPAQFCYRLLDFKTSTEPYAPARHHDLSAQPGRGSEGHQAVLLPTLARQRWR